MEFSPVERLWSPLLPAERRVLGVLVEKQKTTPEYYPMTVAAVVTACNQKTNRDPVTNYDADDVEEVLQGLRQKGAATLVEGVGRAVKWKHNLYEWLGLKGRPTELAILAELMLRGPQTEGELRTRASRMDPIADLPALQALLGPLVERGLVVYLSPPGQKRGASLTHGLYPPDEFERVRQAFDHAALTVETAARSDVRGELDAFREELAAVRDEVRALRDELAHLKTVLGA